MPVVVETPKFRFRDLVEFRGYQQGAIAFLQYGTAVGAVYFIVGPLLHGLLPDMHWGVGVASAALLIRGLLGAVVSPLTGWLVHRFGVRPVVMTGGVATAGFTALTGLVQNPIQFGLVFGVALTIADGFMGYIPSATVVQKWFISRRAVVMGFVNSGAGFGGLIFAPLMAVLVGDLGWRRALFALGAIIFVLAIPSVFLRDRPQDVGQWVDGVEGRTIPEHGDTDVIGTVQTKVGQMMRSPVYWMIFTIFGIEAWALGTYAAYQVLYLETVGVSAVVSSGALGIAAGIAAVSGILFSRLSDRFSPYYVLLLATASMTAGSVIFLGARSGLPLYFYSVFFGAGYGLLVPTIPVAVSRYFGALNFSKGFGFGQILGGVLGGLGPFVTGQIVDATGSYHIPVYLITGLLALSVVIAALARPPKHALASVVRADPEHRPQAPSRVE
ncbi:MFS transporter [Amycolatopsis sp. K13G38]|uniref:MFS transporter n=1 Tax=Amycolatopsis acididurans TaxID=2724524 RepID=A0ABX1J478_9PSEU|nr:MFS transporter [Amycolatopsis acididurans]NKQ54464.1 MFS transporter [Amycolatopsis acididurans]